jgi:glycosyltransferase involved in cell wall biosynthesis
MVKTKKKLAIVSSHPIQYNAPLFKILAERDVVDVNVFYTWSQAEREVFDPGFGKSREWDIPLLEGYHYCFVDNVSTQPGSHHFMGIKNPTLVDKIRCWQPDAVLVYGWSFHSHLKCLRYFKNKIPVFFRGDSTLLDERGGLRSIVRRVALKWVYRHVDKAFYVGANNKAYFQKHGLKSVQLVFAPHAVDNERFANLSKEEIEQARAWRANLGFNETDTVILFVGKLEEKKNPGFVLQLAERLNDRNIKFLIVGSGHLETVLKNQCQDQRVVFLGFQNQSKMPLVYRLGDTLILPSKGPGETWGLAVNEAMAAGLPVILSSKVGGAPDLVPEQSGGLIFDENDFAKVESYIRRLHTKKDYYNEIQKNVKTHIQEFTFEKIAEAIESRLR